MKSKVVDRYLARLKNWQEESMLLREICLECGLIEDFKWMHPCYTHDDKNIVLIHGFKAYCALLFHKGVLLGDPEKLLIQQTKNVQSARQLRFTNTAEIMALKPIIKAYIFEAIEVEKAGLEVKMKKTAEFEMPEEFQKVLAENEALNKAFYALTPGRQRGYLLHFSQAKKSKTREARIEKNWDNIMNGIGFNER